MKRSLTTSLSSPGISPAWGKGGPAGFGVHLPVPSPTPSSHLMIEKVLCERPRGNLPNHHLPLRVRHTTGQRQGKVRHGGAPWSGHLAHQEASSPAPEKTPAGYSLVQLEGSLECWLHHRIGHSSLQLPALAQHVIHNLHQLRGRGLILPVYHTHVGSPTPLLVSDLLGQSHALW